MAILRAGPFASLTDSFLDESGDPPVRDTYPVNCALDFNSSTWQWRYLKLPKDNPIFSAGSYVDGAVNFSFTGGGSPSGFFYYQATSDVDMVVSYDLSADTPDEPGDPFVTLNVVVYVDGVLDFFDVENSRGNVSISGNPTITLPATTVPKRVRISCFIGGGNSDATGEAELSIS